MVMKRLLLIISSILALAACSNEGFPVHKENKAIAFSNVSTRAGVDDLKATGFGVWAGLKHKEANVYTPILTNEKVYWDTRTDAEGWNYDNTRYWLDDCDFYFVACYPYEENSTHFTFDEANNAVKLTVAETPSDVDYLVATKKVDTSVEGFQPAPVSLTFSHMLTQVSVKIWREGVKHKDDQMRITNVTLRNLAKAGSYSSETNSWTPANGKLNLEYVNSNLQDTDNIGAAQEKDGSLQFGGVPAEPFGEMLLMPQTLDNSSNKVALEISYQLKRNNAVDWESAELETVLPSITWENNKRYTYNVVLSSVTDITIAYIQTKVDPWGTPQVGGTVIIK